MSAGIVLVKEFPEGLRVLGLKTPKGFDLPKGHIEKNETTIEAALRETYEETGISDICFPWGLTPIKFDNIILYIGKTTQEPKIRKNPKTGLYEHECAVWFLWGDLINHVYDYLKLAIINIGLLIHEL